MLDNKEKKTLCAHDKGRREREEEGCRIEKEKSSLESLSMDFFFMTWEHIHDGSLITAIDLEYCITMVKNCR